MTTTPEPVPTVLCGVMRRGWSPDVIADLTDVAYVRTFDRAANRTTLTFDAELAPEVATAVWERMTSTDDVDQARRALLRAAVADSDYPRRVLAAYVLGEPMPDPPEPLPEETP